jgi:hypothetical protein
MTVINTPLKKLDEIPILIPKNSLRWSPVSVKLKYLRRSLMELAKELNKENDSK